MKSILIFSGGLDSTTLLYYLLTHSYEVKCLGFDYGQRHSKELSFARDTCNKLKVDFQVADLSSVGKTFLGGSSQTSEEVTVPHGHYADESMKLTVVPNRNMIMLSIAIGWAISLKFDLVAYGAHAGDHTIYPDCRKEFVSAMNTAALLADWEKVSLYTPFIDMTKTEIAKKAGALGVPLEETWSCYEGKEIHCGKCGTCVERIEAIRGAGIKDPTIYGGEMKCTE